MSHLNPRRNKAILVDSLVSLPFLLIPFSIIDSLPASVGGKVSILGLVLAMAYMILRDGVNGQSIGKRVFKIQVVRIVDESPIGFGMAILRGVLNSLPIIGWIDFIITFFTPNSQRFSDKLLGLKLIIQA